jgi:hypothetical protein
MWLQRTDEILMELVGGKYASYKRRAKPQAPIEDNLMKLSAGIPMAVMPLGRVDG